ncbi:MAG: zf-TFIIB domain-containing protein [Nitrospiraceae bacterium]|nr:zf-TFIIB domain-containing protein [Nitrospiraceae bacterium]
MELIACPQCGKYANPRSALCPFCGGRLGDAKALAAPVCPRCRVGLELRRDDDIELHACPRCDGLWLDPGEFDVMTAESTVYRKEQLKKEYSRPPLPDSSEYLPCARCGKLMVRKNYGRISGVLIDECGRHGIWLDRGELEKIRHFILDGGLEKEQFREIEKNRAELQDLAEKVDDVAFTQKLIHFWDWKRWFFRP